MTAPWLCFAVLAFIPHGSRPRPSSPPSPWYRGEAFLVHIAVDEGVGMLLEALKQTGPLIDEFALSIDLAPTLLAGRRRAFRRHGRPQPRAAPWGAVPEDLRTSLLIEYNSDTVFPRIRNMGYKAVRSKRWKCIRYNGLDGMDELYDLKADPYEMNNVVDRPHLVDVRRRLNRELDGFFAEGCP